MKTLTILRGCPGAGKAWYAAGLTGAVLFSPRNYDDNADQKCFESFCRALLKSEQHIVLIDTNLYKHNWFHYAEEAWALGRYDTEIVTIIPESPLKAFLRNRYAATFQSVYQAYHESLVHPMSMPNHKFHYEDERMNGSPAPTLG